MDGIPADAFSPAQAVPSEDLTAQVEAFRQRLREDDDLQRQLRRVTSSAGLAEVVEAAGFRLSAAQLVKHFARRLLDADDALALRNFDNFGWDQGELAWLLKTWELIPRRPWAAWGLRILPARPSGGLQRGGRSASPTRPR